MFATLFASLFVQGILLGLVTCLIGGAFIVLCDRFISRRPGYAGWAVATTAGNAVGRIGKLLK